MIPEKQIEISKRFFSLPKEKRQQYKIALRLRLKSLGAISNWLNLKMPIPKSRIEQLENAVNELQAA
jgi:hypothetical protein